jgi:hypothetical protein
MTMVPDPSRKAPGRTAFGRAPVASRVVALAACLLGAAHAAAQPPPAVHYQHHALMPPGAIGGWQLRRGGPLAGHFQPVEVRGPEGTHVSMAPDGRFEAPQPVPLVRGLLVGAVYRLRVTGIPLAEGQELFPTIEVIDRLYPPPGEETRFPIVVELTREDMDLALAGKFVVRVIYLEDPDAAIPVAQDGGQQPWFEAAPGEDPLRVADAWGRPVAILRIGSVVPQDLLNPDIDLFGSPPYMVYPPVSDPPAAAGLGAGALHFDAPPGLVQTGGVLLR